MSDRTIAVALINPTVAGADITVQVDDDPNLWLRGTTSTDGYVAWQWSDSLGDSVLAITADGYEPYVQSIHWKTFTDPNVGPAPLNHQLTVGGDLPPLTPVTSSSSPSTPGPIVPLYADGVTLRNPDGQRISLCGYDMFTALRMVLDGLDLQPFLDESHALGFNCWRVFGEASATENGYYTVDPHEPGYYEALDSLAARLYDAGIYLLFTCYADNQVLKCNLDHWHETARTLRPYDSGVFLSGGNEWQKNGFDPLGLPDPDLTWWSRGSSLGDEQPPIPNGATFCEFHPRRDYPKSLDDTVASATWIQYQYGYTIPLIIDEPPRMGYDGSGLEYEQPGIVWQFARHYASQCAGAVFHARPGQKGVLIDPASTTGACAQAWVTAWEGVEKC